jgi:hypothetical protein
MILQENLYSKMYADRNEFQEISKLNFYVASYFIAFITIYKNENYECNYL